MKRSVSGITLILLLVNVSALAFGIGSAKGWLTDGTIYIEGDVHPMYLYTEMETYGTPPTILITSPGRRSTIMIMFLSSSL